MVEWQPDHTMGVGVEIKSLIDQSQIMHQVAVSQHYPFRHTCRSRGVLEKCQCIAVNSWILP